MTDKTDSKEREVAEQWLRERYGAYRGHFAWRELEEAFLAGRASLTVSAVSGPLMGQPQEMPDLTTLTERGAKAWAGVDAQGLREGAASAGSEPVAYAMFADNGNIRLWSKARIPHPDAKPLYLHPSPPEGMVGGWIASKDQMPPPGVRVFWGDVDSNRVGYDFWAGDDYRWTPSHWMHIPEFPAPPTTTAGSGKGE